MKTEKLEIKPATAVQLPETCIRSVELEKTEGRCHSARNQHIRATSHRRDQRQRKRERESTVSVPEAARKFRIPEETILGWIASDQLPAVGFRVRKGDIVKLRGTVTGDRLPPRNRAGEVKEVSFESARVLRVILETFEVDSVSESVDAITTACFALLMISEPPEDVARLLGISEPEVRRHSSLLETAQTERERNMRQHALWCISQAREVVT